MQGESQHTEYGPIYLSGITKRALTVICRWIEAGQPVMVRGSKGCGKSTLIDYALSSMRTAETVTTLRAFALYGAEDFVARLKRACVKLDTSSQGRTYKPRNGSRLIVVMEDVHLASRNLEELLRQLLQEGGFHEDDLEFAKVSFTLVCTADKTTKLHPRLASIMATYHLQLVLR